MKIIEKLKKGISFIICLCVITGMASIAYAGQVQTAVIDSITVNGAEVTVQGKIQTQNGVVMAGQRVTMLVTNPSVMLAGITDQTIGSDLNCIGEVALETTTGSDGSYTFHFSEPSTASSGIFTVYVGGTFVVQPVNSTFYFLQPALETIIVNAINGATTEAQMESILNATIAQNNRNYTYKELLAINFSGGYQSLTDVNPILSALIGKNFKKADDIRNTFNNTVAVERINQTSDPNGIGSIIAEQNQYLGLDLTQGYQYIANKVSVYGYLVGKSFQTIADIKNAFNNAVNVQLQEERPLAVPQIAVSSIYGNIGQSIPVDITFENQSPIVGLDLNIRFNADVMEIVRQSNVVMNNTFAEPNKLKLVNIDVNTPGNINIDVSYKNQAVECNIQKICTLNLLIKNGAGVNTYPIMAGGKIQVFDHNLNIIRTLELRESSGGITVQKLTSASGEGTGGGGGRSGDLTPIVTTTPIQPPAPTSVPTSAGSRFADDESIPQWARDGIYRLAEKGVLDGIPKGDGTFEFKPNDPLTRSQFIKMIVTALNLVDESANVNFDDVKQGEWYYKYISSAAKLGVTKGISQTTFGVESEITRQDMAVMAMRALEISQRKLSISITPEEFIDEENIASYAKESIKQMQSARILEGTDGSFAPLEATTRAVAAKVIYALLLNSK